MCIFDMLDMAGMRLWSGDMEIEGNRLRVYEKVYISWIPGVHWRTLGYMIRDEAQTDKLSARAEKRAWQVNGNDGKLRRRSEEKLGERM